MQYFSITALSITYDTIYTLGNTYKVTVSPGVKVTMDSAEESTMVKLCDINANQIWDGSSSQCQVMTVGGVNDCTLDNGVLCIGWSSKKSLSCKEFYHLGNKFLILDPDALFCDNSCPNSKKLIRSPGSNTANSICNKDCDTDYTTTCEVITSAQMRDLPTSIQCNAGKDKIGYDCLDPVTAEKCKFDSKR